MASPDHDPHDDHRHDHAHEAPPSLSRPAFLGGLAALLAVFLCLHPVWRAQDMGAWNENIGWSYAPIPLVVAALLAFERKLTGASMVVETMKMTFVKFALTFLIAQLVWGLDGVPGTGRPPAGPVPRDAESDRWAVRPPPPATPVAAEATGTVSGTVRDGAGQPVSGALVWIQEGLEAYVFPPPAGPAVLVNRGAGFEPRFEIVRAFQPLSLRSGDDELHTAVFSDRRGKRLANYPVIPGEERSLMFDRGLGWIHVRCSAHGEAEPGCDLLVLASAFVTRTDAGGAFSFQGVPAGSLRLATRTGAQTIMGEVTVTAGGDAEALLRAVPERDSR